MCVQYRKDFDLMMQNPKKLITKGSVYVTIQYGLLVAEI
jgi:hypothetical protein